MAIGRSWSFLINKQSTEQLKGIAIILVVLGHLFVTKFINSTNPAFNYLGAQGVALFLILSGYGLTKSFLQRGIDKSFLLRRWRVVLIPYSIVTFVWFLYDFWHGKLYSLKIIILSLAGFDFHLTMDATMWYISYILIWYGVYYILFNLKLPNLVKVGLLFGVAYLFRYHSRVNLTEQVYWQWGLHAFMFPLGALFAFLPQPQWNEKTQKVGLGFLGLIALGIYLLNLKNNPLGLGPYMLSNFSFAVGIMALIMLGERMGHDSRLLRFVGSISYEIYLLEAVFMYKLCIPYFLPNKILSLCLYILLLTGASLLLKKIAGGQSRLPTKTPPAFSI
jgi:peptidoglycan/LPS O-acetylase OafA/YrhL